MRRDRFRLPGGPRRRLLRLPRRRDDAGRGHRVPHRQRQHGTHRGALPATTPIAALTHNAVTRRCSWGVQPLAIREFGDDAEGAVDAIRQHLLASGLLHVGDRLVLTAGLPWGAQDHQHPVSRPSSA